MRWLMAAFVAVHGLIHLMGFAKGLGYASLPQLVQPISRGMAFLWLAACLLMLATAVALIVWPRGWWIVGAVALVVSQAAIVSSWRDAWAGTIANAVVLVAVIYGWGTYGPRSFQAQFERDVASRRGRQTQVTNVTE